MNYKNQPLLENIRVNMCWNELIFKQLDELSRIWAIISHGNPFTPGREKALRFLERDIAKIKIVILGQDPYPQPGAATGRAFEVTGLKSWVDSFRQVSLKNIVRLIHNSLDVGRDAPGAPSGRDNLDVGRDAPGAPDEHDACVNLDVGRDAPGAPSGRDNAANKASAACSEIPPPYPAPYSSIKEEIKEGVFRIARPDELFVRWEAQGVLLLNKYLTCEVNKPGSHREIWRGFTTGVIEFLSLTNPALIWMLWGEDARSSRADINGGTVFESRHPMMCSQKYEDDFLKSNCFSTTSSFIDWTGPGGV